MRRDDQRLRMRMMLVAIAIAVIGMLIALWTGSAKGQQRQLPANRPDIQLSFAPVVKATAPAVVNIYVRGRTQIPENSLAADPLFRRFFGMPEERAQSSLGSGVIVSADGLVVTNTHVVKIGGTAEIKVVLADRRELDARILVQDEKTDIAVLKLEGAGAPFPFLQLGDSDGLEVGDLVLAIGNPFGVGQTVTQGIISALARTEIGRSDAQVFLQTDAAINPGNSGGALVDMNGRLIGINTAIFSRSGGSHGIGFAIPSNLVRLFVESAATGRRIERPWIGARLENVSREIAGAVGVDRLTGAVVTRVFPNSPAAEARLEVGDVIVAIDGTEVNDPRAVLYRLTTRGVGQSARLDVRRNGRPVATTLPVRAAPPPGRDDIRNLSGPHPFDGARVANLGPALAEELGVDEESGAIIVSVRQGGVAANLGLQAGDIIVGIGRQQISNLRDLEGQLTGRRPVWQVSIKRGGRVVSFQVAG
ncbi:MAG: hypothetical protein RL291_2127 [Pseudomonadota bacterium]